MDSKIQTNTTLIMTSLMFWLEFILDSQLQQYGLNFEMSAQVSINLFLRCCVTKKFLAKLKYNFRAQEKHFYKDVYRIKYMLQ